MGQLRVFKNLAVIPQTDPLPAPITMANSHQFDDVAHIDICLGIGNHKYTICIINSQIAGVTARPVMPVCLATNPA